MKIHSICKTKLEKELGEAPARGYFWWRCPKCNRRVPMTEVDDKRK